MASLQLVDINIEGGKHLDEVRAFIRATKPEVLCLQEVFAMDLDFLRESFDFSPTPVFYEFAPCGRVLDTDHGFPVDPRGVWGNAMFSTLPIEHARNTYYFGNNTSPIYRHPTSNERSLLRVEVEKEGERFVILTTHFTWTPDGQANDDQRRDLPNMLKILADEPEFILTGDFNAPRGRETWNQIAALYHDNIPPEITTTVDNTMHRDRAKNLQLVVDGIFSTPGYQVSNVQVHTGVSDHCALTGQILNVLG